MRIFKMLGLSNERRVPVDESPEAELGSELDALIAQNQELGRQIDAIREKRREINVRMKQLLQARQDATVEGQVVDVKVGV